jgi:hypothetical protein
VTRRYFFAEQRDVVVMASESAQTQKKARISVSSSLRIFTDPGQSALDAPDPLQSAASGRCSKFNVITVREDCR